MENYKRFLNMEGLSYKKNILKENLKTKFDLDISSHKLNKYLYIFSKNNNRINHPSVADLINYLDSNPLQLGFFAYFIKGVTSINLLKKYDLYMNSPKEIEP